MTDVDDLAALVNLQESFQSLHSEVDSDELSSLAQAVDSAASLVEEIILRETEDANATFELICKIVEFAGEVLQAVEAGESPDSISSPLDAGGQAGAPSGGEDIDEELLSAWVSECEHSLAELESTVVEVEDASDPGELIAEIRRAVHTLKGESGVLSLHVAQKLCHEAESLIDLRKEQAGPFPVDELLALLDWMKGYVAALADNPRTAVPPHDELLAALTSATGADAESTADTGLDAEAEVVSEVEAELEAAVEPTVGDGPEHESTDSEPAGEAEDDQPEPDDGALIEFPADVSMDDSLTDFLCEAKEHLASSEEALLDLEQNPEDAELINTVFRAFHTIKGVAGFLNLGPIVDVAHTAETLLDQVRNGAIALTPAYSDLTLQSCDMLSQLIGHLEDGPAPTQAQFSDLVNRLKRATEGDIEEVAPAKPNDDMFVPLGEILVRMEIATEDEIVSALDRQQEGAERLRGLLMEADLTNVDSVENALVSGAEGAEIVRSMLVELGFATEDQLDDAIEAKKESGKRLGELLKLSKDQLRDALREQRRSRREDANASTGADGQAQAKARIPQPSAKPAPGGASKAGGPAGARKRVDQTVKVNTGRLDNMVTMVGELVIAQQMVVQDPTIQGLTAQRIQRNLGHVGKIIRDLQEVAMSLRMVTVKSTFQKMARLVRDISVKSGKKISFRMEGEDTELDRNVVEEIGDPLVHMIRNACDHGIESVDDRVKAGKAETGELTLSAYHQGGSIIIDVKDDGKGLDREKILNKAIERGVYTPDRDPSEIPDAEIYNLVFLPGFSTADKVTDISGRGVGMDVVRRNIEALRGKAEIDSTPGRGSVFRMRLPLTMAIIDGMVVRVGSQRYVIPTLAIEQSFRPTEDQLSTVVDRGEMVSVRGSLLPIYRLRRVFNLDEGIEDVNEALLIVLETNDSRCCLMVDEIIGQQQVVIKSLGDGVGSIAGVSGGAILGDGLVALILDVGGLVNLATVDAA